MKKPKKQPTDADILVTAMRKRAEQLTAEIKAFKEYWLPKFPLELD